MNLSHFDQFFNFTYLDRFVYLTHPDWFVNVHGSSGLVNYFHHFVTLTHLDWFVGNMSLSHDSVIGNTCLPLRFRIGVRCFRNVSICGFLRFRSVRECMVLLLYISRVVFMSLSTLQPKKNIFISTEI